MALVLAVASSPASAADQTLLLNVQFNGQPSDKYGEFILRDGKLMALRADLRDLGFKVAVTGGSDLVDLSALPALKWRVDHPTQTLHVQGSDANLLPALLGSATRTAARPALDSGTGATLDYAVNGDLSGDRLSANGLFALRLFSPRGVVNSGLLVRAGGPWRGQSAATAIRLDSTLTLSDDESLRRYRAGDFISEGLGSSRAVRMGGLQITSDFSMRPDMITFPLPALAGSAAIPSTLDVFVNGTRQLSAEIAPGPFEVPQIPVVTGSGTVSMAVTDLTGRRVVTTLHVYASRSESRLPKGTAIPARPFLGRFRRVAGARRNQLHGIERRARIWRL